MAEWPYSTAAWQRLRRLKLSETPLCQACTLRARKVIAEHVDHVVSIKSGGHAFPSLDGLRSLCAPCHSIKTNAVDRKGGKGVTIKGCDVNGLPLDPSHPFLQCRPNRDGLDDLTQNAVGIRQVLGTADWCTVASDCGARSMRKAIYGMGHGRGVHGRPEIISQSLLRDNPLQGQGTDRFGPAGAMDLQLLPDWGV